MKKNILFLTIFFIFIMEVANVAYGATARVKVTAVRIRETASTDSNIVTNIYEDDEVEILEEAGEWYKVKYQDKIGYAKSEFFTKNETNSDETSQNNTVVENETSDGNKPNEIISENAEITESNIVPNEEINESPNENMSEENTEVIQEISVGGKLNIKENIEIRLIPNLLANANIEIKQGELVDIETELGNWYKISNGIYSGWITKVSLESQNVIQEQIPEQQVIPQEPEEVQPTNEPEIPSEPEQPAVEVPEPEETSASVTPEPENTGTNRTAIVTVETARVREKPSTSAEIIDVLDQDDIVIIIGEEGDFYKITSQKINSGYISKKLVNEKNITSRSSTEERASIVQNDVVSNDNTVEETSTKTEEVVEFAKQYLGYPYVLGCSTPENGFDCSGFTRYVFGHFGYKLGQIAAEQTSVGEIVERENLKTGDLLLFYDEGKSKIGHCGIYIGNGEFIHSANPQRGVVIDNLNTNSYYSERFVTARRIV